jgi:cytosine/adenosine deaminase-related metal-dependent hydrolase
MTRTLIKGGSIISMDRRIGDFVKGDVLIEDDKIVNIARSIRAANTKVIDATSMIVMPGFVNAHIHTWQTGIRGIAGNWSISEYLHIMHTQIAPRFTANDTYLGNLMGSLNQINSGTTTVFDWCHNNATPAHTDAAIAGLREAGIRAVFGHGSPKPDAKKGQIPYTHMPHPRSELERLRKGAFASDDGIITLAMAALGPDFSIWEVTEHDFRLAKELDLIISTHVWGGPNSKAGQGYRKLAKQKLLGPNHNMVHGVYLGDNELKLIVDSGASVTVTPEVELQMGYGAPLTGRLRKLGVNPSVGIDLESNISGDMFGAIRIAMQSQRNLDNQRLVKKSGLQAQQLSITPREALGWATIESAKALKLDKKVGSLKPGKQADLILINKNDLNLFPVHNPIESVVFHANGSNVDTVMIAGEIKKQNGKLKYRGIERKKELLARSGRRILKGLKIQ